MSFPMTMVEVGAVATVAGAAANLLLDEMIGTEGQSAPPLREALRNSLAPAALGAAGIGMIGAGIGTLDSAAFAFGWRGAVVGGLALGAASMGAQLTRGVA